MQGVVESCRKSGPWQLPPRWFRSSTRLSLRFPLGGFLCPFTCVGTVRYITWRWTQWMRYVCERPRAWVQEPCRVRVVRCAGRRL